MGGTHCDTASRKVWIAEGWQSFCTTWLPLQKKGVRFDTSTCTHMAAHESVLAKPHYNKVLQ
jgi:hypothetical protein